jgi:hypothetical protein
MSLLKYIFGNHDNENLMDEAPYLAPWYFAKDKPRLSKNNNQLKWRKIDKVGEKNVSVTVLTDDKDSCYGIVDMYSYLLPARDGKSFLMWCRTLDKVFGLQPINIFYYEVDNLKAFDDTDKEILKMKERKQPFHFSIEPTAKVKFEFNPTEDAMKIDFPDEFKKFGEFIFITELQNLYNNPDTGNYWHNTVFLCIKSDTGWIFSYPQDWFNKSDCDFGYQWITRAVRNPITKAIHGQGIRLSDFILDETNRNSLNKEYS